MELHWCVIFHWPFSWNNFYVVCDRDQATSVISVGSKGHTTFMCGLISFDLGSDYSYKFPLHSLCKGEALELFSVRKQLISSQNRDLFPLLLKCRSSFIRSLSVFWVRPHTWGCPSRCFRSRTVSPTVAKWFVPDARGTIDSVYRFGPLWDA
jgi:hypothetical protein